MLKNRTGPFLFQSILFYTMKTKDHKRKKHIAKKHKNPISILGIVGIIVTVVSIVIGVIALVRKPAPPTLTLSDTEFTYNMAMVRLEIRLETVHLNLLSNILMYASDSSFSSEQVCTNLGWYYKEVGAVKDVLRHLSPPEEYVNSYNNFLESLKQYSNLILSTKEAMVEPQQQRELSPATRKVLDDAFDRLRISRQYRLILFARHYAKLVDDIWILAGEFYESGKFEDAIYYNEQVFHAVFSQGNTEKIAKVAYHLAIAYAKVANTGRYDLIKDIAREDRSLGLAKSFWLQNYCHARARFLLEESLKQWRRIDDQGMVAEILTMLGSMYVFPFAEPDQAIANYKKARALFQKTDPKMYFKVTNAIGAIYSQLARDNDNDEERARLCREALRCFSDAQDILAALDPADSEYSRLSFMVEYNLEIANEGCNASPVYDSFY